jgi:hypothetical protein
MKFDEKEMLAAALIGFDMIEGPMVKWVQFLQTNAIQLDMNEFLMNFYLSFRGGNEGLQPLAIMYQDFYLVAFPRGLELCCLFLRNDNADFPKLNRLSQIAAEIIKHVDNIESEKDAGAQTSGMDQTDYEEIKRIVVNLLHGQEMSTPELRRYFKLSNSEIWQLMGQLESNNAVVRTQKIGRTQFWTAAF